MSDLDLIVLGSGVAGLSAAVRAAEGLGQSVAIVTKGRLNQATTRWAQGGVAAALSGNPEETDLHLADTLAAGGGLCDLDAVRVLVDEGPACVNNLIALGARFDRDSHGELELAREGGHSVPRVVHAGGAATGAEIERALVVAARTRVAEIHERCFALELLVEDGRCRGVSALMADGTRRTIRARHTLIAAGGAGQLFAVTTNPLVATGDGVAMALRAGAAVADLEFFQFHPTALHHPSMPRKLLSEALRGHGALLRDRDGERFVDELLPRDVVSRAVTAKMLEQGQDHVWLDATVLDHFETRFPTIAADLASVGLDPVTDLLPVAPAAHHQCGGILADLDGATSLPGLWAAGETATSGVHGANRLASNSLLEGMVFGTRVVDAIGAGGDGPRWTGAMRSLPDGSGIEVAPVDGPSLAVSEKELLIGGVAVPHRLMSDEVDDVVEPDEDTVAGYRDVLQRAMTVHAGVLRTADSLATATAELKEVSSRIPASPTRRDVWEVRNLLDVGGALLAAASARTESRGAHARQDHPDPDEAQRHRLVVIADR